MLRTKLSCKLMLASFIALLLLACEQKTELQKAEEAAIAFFQNLDQGDKKKAISLLLLNIDGEEEIKKDEQQILDVKIDMFVSEVIKDFAQRKGIKNITATESKFINPEETRADVQVYIEFNDDSIKVLTVPLAKKDGKCFAALADFF